MANPNCDKRLLFRSYPPVVVVLGSLHKEGRILFPLGKVGRLFGEPDCQALATLFSTFLLLHGPPRDEIVVTSPFVTHAVLVASNISKGSTVSYGEEFHSIPPSSSLLLRVGPHCP